MRRQGERACIQQHSRRTTAAREETKKRRRGRSSSTTARLPDRIASLLLSGEESKKTGASTCLDSSLSRRPPLVPPSLKPVDHPSIASLFPSDQRSLGQPALSPGENTARRLPTPLPRTVFSPSFAFFPHFASSMSAQPSGRRGKGKGKASATSSNTPSSTSAPDLHSPPDFVPPTFVPPPGALKSRAPGRQNVACRYV